jgi:hypothetical protein
MVGHKGTRMIHSNGSLVPQKKRYYSKTVRAASDHFYAALQPKVMLCMQVSVIHYLGAQLIPTATDAYLRTLLTWQRQRSLHPVDT